jgi:hypothetical protein
MISSIAFDSKQALGEFSWRFCMRFTESFSFSLENSRLKNNSHSIKISSILHASLGVTYITNFANYLTSFYQLTAQMRLNIKSTYLISEAPQFNPIFRFFLCVIVMQIKLNTISVSTLFHGFVYTSESFSSPKLSDKVS